LKNLQIGYTLPSLLVKKIDASRVRLFVSGQNLLTITGYKGLNPEIGGGPTTGNVDAGTYPISKLFTLGAQIVF
jgi:hypothetical protein